MPPRFPAILAAILVFLLGLTGVSPPIGHVTWALEVAPACIALLVCASTYKRFRLSNVAYVFIFLQALVLVYGGYYGYAQTPLGDWLRQAFHLQRNNYDRLGHLAQGVCPAVVVRELLLRRTPLRQGPWLSTVIVFVGLGISAMYELMEWSVALVLEDGSTAFLGTQGDPWDTQWDMFCALVGATLSVTCLTRLHDRSLAKLPASAGRLQL